MILNKAKYYYQQNKERLKKQVRDKYRNLSEEEKNKKREYVRNRYHHMSEGKKQRLKEYQKKLSRSKQVSILIVCFAANIIIIFVIAILIVYTNKIVFLIDT